jgi:hypothetical protein
MRKLWIALALSGVMAVGLAASARQDEPAEVETKAQEKAKGGGPMDRMPDLVKGLKETEGCLGVETARTSSGKNVIFAWFKDKEGVINWYESEMHQRVMFTFASGPGDREPLAEVPDGTGPILVVASITMSDKPAVQGFRMPISQIAMELYTPLPGGAAVGGRFAPDSVKVPGLRDYTPKAEDKPSEKSDPDR